MLILYNIVIVILFSFQQPGKLNLKNFAIVNEAIARMTVTGENDNNIKGEKGEIIIMESNKKSSKEFFEHAPLAAPEDDSDDDLAEAEAHYTQINENNFNFNSNQTTNNQLIAFAHDTTINKTKLRQRREKGQQST